MTAAERDLPVAVAAAEVVPALVAARVGAAAVEVAVVAAQEPARAGWLRRAGDRPNRLLRIR